MIILIEFYTTGTSKVTIEHLDMFELPLQNILKNIAFIVGFIESVLSLTVKHVMS